MEDLGNVHLTKAEWRAVLRKNRRSALSEHSAEATALAGHVAEEAAQLPTGATVCAYVPYGSEPGSLELAELLVNSGRRVLLPVVVNKSGALEWTEYRGKFTLVAGPYQGLLEPSGPRLSPSAIASASLILVPALAVDFRGVRLGKGAGHYDRSLSLTDPHAQVLAVIRDDELLRELPAEPHDIRMMGVVTPRRGRISLPCAASA